MNKYKFSEAPFFGAAYYPEGLTEDKIEYDISMMKKAGLNTVRLAEFSWSTIEPAEGQYDFSWLHRVINKLSENGINSILCTPGATPPKWLTDKYPDTLSVRYNGTVSSHGARLHYCPNSRTYLALLEKVNTKLAKEFSNEQSVIGWQIDNEVYIPFGEGCFCPKCVNGFQNFLKKRFGTIENLNSAYQLTLWSQKYDDFDKVPAPRPDTPHHPSLKLAWLEYQDENVRNYVFEQVATLKNYTDKPIGTDMMPLPMIDHAKMSQKTDVMMFNHYVNENSVSGMFFWFDYIKMLSSGPWWSTETDPNVNGGTYFSAYRPKGFVRLNSWLPFLFGGEANLYWHFRAHSAGHELMHGSIIDSYGRPTYTFDEISSVGKELNKSRDFLNSTGPVQAKVAVHYSAWAEKFYSIQSVCGNDYRSIIYEYYYRPLVESGIRTDVIPTDRILDGYNIVFSPFLPSLEDGGISDKIGKWIENGGTWIVGPLTDIRNLNGAKTDKPIGMLEQMGDIYEKYSVVPNEKYPFEFVFGGKKYKNAFWADAFSVGGSARSIAEYTGESYEFAANSVISERKIGKGKIVILGTVLIRDAFLSLIEKYISEDYYISPKTSSNVLCVPREGKCRRGLIAVEYRHSTGKLVLSKPGVNILTGERLSGEIVLNPYDVMVIEYE